MTGGSGWDGGAEGAGMLAGQVPAWGGMTGLMPEWFGR